MDTGVMFMFPGNLIPHTLDPTSRPWYRRALAFPGRIVATGPYVDHAGDGRHIITLSRTVFDGK